LSEAAHLHFASWGRGGVWPLARYLVIILLGAVLGVCSAGEITNVTQPKNVA
jgi:hypothetical protein